MTNAPRVAVALLMSLALLAHAQRPDLVIGDFEKDDYGRWGVTGTALGPGPARGTLPRQNPVSGFAGRRLVNTYHHGDGTTGTLTSPDFTIDRHYVTLHVGMGDGASAGGSGGEYFVGEFDGVTFRSDTPADAVRWTDYGKDFYASVTWDNVPPTDGRRLWIGWMNNWRYANDIPTGPDWRGMMSVPRELSLRRVGDQVRLIQRPVRELKTLRDRHRALPQTRLVSGTMTLEDNAGDAVEIIAEFTPQDGARTFGLKVCVGDGQETVVGYDTAKRELFIDRTRSGNTAFHRDFPGRHTAPLAPAADGKVKLHVLVDRYSVEPFGNDGEVAITDLVFPANGRRGVHLYCDDGAVNYTLDLWQLRPTSAPR